MIAWLYFFHQLSEAKYGKLKKIYIGPALCTHSVTNHNSFSSHSHYQIRDWLPTDKIYTKGFKH